MLCFFSRSTNVCKRRRLITHFELPLMASEQHSYLNKAAYLWPIESFRRTDSLSGSSSPMHHRVLTEYQESVGRGHSVYVDFIFYLWHPPTYPAQQTGYRLPAAFLHRLDWQQVQPRPMDEMVLREGQECPRVHEKGGVWVERHRVERSPLVG
ncbi:hypothetical protein EMCRGX_G005919 [Ephydatia muelleri]